LGLERVPSLPFLLRQVRVGVVTTGLTALRDDGDPVGGSGRARADRRGERRRPGISAADLPYLGARFFRGGDLNARPKGLGLGLALVTSALELHGAVLEVESAEGRGSRFSFRLSPLGASSETPVNGEVVHERA
jgi:hypothetical protein